MLMVKKLLNARFACLALMLLVCSACTRPLVTGRDVLLPPVEKVYNAPYPETFAAVETVLNQLQYKVEYADRDAGVLRTAWKPTTIDSHYLELFGKPDYGTTASYYHLAVRVKSEGPSQTRVEVSAPLRTVVARMKSSYRLEKKLLSKVADQLRPADIEVTNIGVIQPNSPAPIQTPVPVSP